MKLKKLLKVWIYYIIVFIFVVIMLKGYIDITKKDYWESTPTVDNGIIMVDNDTLRKYKTIPLNGNWVFYPNVFLKPNQTKIYQGSKGEIFVPSIWSGQTFGEINMKMDGYGTYQMKLVNTGKAESVRLYFLSAPAESYRVYINDEEIFEIGKVGETEDSSYPRYKSKIVECELDKQLTITIHVSNYVSEMGGYHKPIILGEAENIQTQRDFNFAKDIFALGILVMFFLYFSLVWIKNRHNGYAIACFVYAAAISIMYLLTSNEMLIYEIWPKIPFRIQEIMNYMLAISGGCVYILLISHLYPEECHRKVKAVSLIKTIIIIFINIIFERKFVCKMTMFFGIVTIVEFAYGIFVLSKATVAKKEGTIPILFGTIVLISAIIYDILYIYVIVISPYGLITPLALAVFILSFAVVVARQYEKSFQDVIDLSEKLLEMDRVKDQFLANTSHELRTPINSMIALTKSLMDESELLKVNQKESLNMIVSSGERLSNLINDLLDYSSIKHGQIKLVESFFDISQIIEDTIKELKPMLNSKGIEFSYEVKNNIPMVFADKYRLIQVIYNIIGNSIKFTDKGGHIYISIESREKNIFICVEDTGIGIDNEKIGDIFQSFEQADKEISKKYGGLGLGLSISKEIIHLHQGDILVESKVGKGTIFKIVLPVKAPTGIDNKIMDNDERVISINESIENDSYLYIKGETEDTIIIIDDYYSNIFAAASILKSEGYSIKGYIYPSEGLNEILNNKNVVLAIIDLMMPELSGDEVCKQVREKYTLLELPILILTASMHMSGLLRSFEAGANDFLHKPFELEELKARVSTLIRLKQTEEKAIENEIGKLQAQMNPHFLCNAMIAIAECCYEDGEKAANIVMDLADYLRFSFAFDYNVKEIPLTKELELVKVYLAIEKVRFEDELDYEFELEDEKYIMIPPFSVQTIVENAVRHGIRQKEGGGKIIIKGNFEDNYYTIKITDSGIGMSEVDLNLVLAGKKATGTGVGIANVSQRIKSIHGTQLEIESIYGQGTTVTIRLRRGEVLDA